MEKVHPGERHITNKDSDSESSNVFFLSVCVVETCLGSSASFWEDDVHVIHVFFKVLVLGCLNVAS
jgi:hypothetical protein